MFPEEHSTGLRPLYSFYKQYKTHLIDFYCKSVVKDYILSHLNVSDDQTNQTQVKNTKIRVLNDNV